jgi:hypothetical protein
MKPQIHRILTKTKLSKLKDHVSHVRNCFDWPGVPYHDVNETDPVKKYNRWFWHNLPSLVVLHHDPKIIKYASDVFGENCKPSYVFLSMYGPEGICPSHTDRPQCKYTIDLVINQDAPWPIYIESTAPEKSYLLNEGDAIFYSGTDHTHYRNAMNVDSKATFCDLAFFHFVPVTFKGALE